MLATDTVPGGLGPPREGAVRVALRVLTGSVEVHHQAVPHVLLDQLQRPLKNLPGPGLLHCVGVPRVPEQGQQVVRGARAAGGRVGRGGKSGTDDQEQVTQESLRLTVSTATFPWTRSTVPYSSHGRQQSKGTKSKDAKNK